MAHDTRCKPISFSNESIICFQREVLRQLNAKTIKIFSLLQIISRTLLSSRIENFKIICIGLAHFRQKVAARHEQRQNIPV